MHPSRPSLTWDDGPLVFTPRTMHDPQTRSCGPFGRVGQPSLRGVTHHPEWWVTPTPSADRPGPAARTPQSLRTCDLWSCIGYRMGTSSPRLYPVPAPAKEGRGVSGVGSP